MVMRRTAVALGTLFAAAYLAHRFYRDWGSTKQECASVLPGDDVIREPEIQHTAAITVDAEPAVVWERVMHLLGRSPTSGVKVGDVVHPPLPRILATRLRMHVAHMDAPCTVVAQSLPDTRHAIEATVTFHIEPQWEHQSRLLIRTRIGLRWPAEVFLVALCSPVVALVVHNWMRDLTNHLQHNASTSPIGRRGVGGGASTVGATPTHTGTSA